MTELTHSRESGTAPGSWLARWLSACADLEDLFSHHHLLDATIEEIDGRRIRVGEHWLIDFASCNYLGLDLDREVIEAIPAYLDRWGTHPSWSWMLGNPALYPEIEARLTELLGAPRCAAAAHPDPHPRLGHPGAGLGRHHLRGLPGPQDHLGRLRGRPGARGHRGPLRPRRPPRPWSGCCAAISRRPGWSAWTASTR
jgi:hypothetical protein